MVKLKNHAKYDLDKIIDSAYCSACDQKLVWQWRHNVLNAEIGDPDYYVSECDCHKYMLKAVKYELAITAKEDE